MTADTVIEVAWAGNTAVEVDSLHTAAAGSHTDREHIRLENSIVGLAVLSDCHSHMAEEQVCATLFVCECALRL
jgi:hypothetical protein